MLGMHFSEDTHLLPRGVTVQFENCKVCAFSQRIYVIVTKNNVLVRVSIIEFRTFLPLRFSMYPAPTLCILSTITFLPHHANQPPHIYLPPLPPLYPPNLLLSILHTPSATHQRNQENQNIPKMSLASQSASPSHTNSLPPPPSPASDIVTLNLGTHPFTTHASTLTRESTFFTALLSGTWGDKAADGSYFIDSDPVVFEHILRYLRSSVFPLFYNKDRGFDYGLYAQMLEQARFLGIEKLKGWIEGQGYLKAVKVVREINVIELEHIHVGDTTDAATEVEYHMMKKKTEKVYVCPRGLGAHRGRRDKCGRQCDNARGDAADLYEDEVVLQVMEVRKRVVFDVEKCFAEE